MYSNDFKTILQRFKMSKKININEDTKLAIDSIVLQRLISHLQKRTDVQNIELMNLSGFCRNCLSNWYQEAANDLGISFSKSEARETVYGMPHELWKEKYQKAATPDQINKFNEKKE